MRFFNTLVIFSTFLFVIGTAVPSFGEEAPEQNDEAPAITDVGFVPAEPETGAEVKVNFKLKEPAVRAEVKWFVNDAEVGPGKYDGVSTHAELGQPVKEGDKVKVEITPFDGGGTEGEVASKSVTVRNAPPEVELVDQKLEGQTYKAKVKATDPQGGQVTLDVHGPQGMKIDQKGNITWTLSSNTVGKFDVKVTAKNEKGAESVLTYSVGIRR
jgi:hypothetical protein